MQRVGIKLIGVVTASLLFAAGCGDSDQEAAFRDATEALADAQAVVVEANAAVESRREAVEAAEGELGGSLAELEEARAELEEARAAVGRHATDPVLFRTVQSRLLEDGALGEVAISARVEKGVVTLTGQVTDPELASRAEEIAGETPGVVGVENRIRVEPPVAAPGV